MHRRELERERSRKRRGGVKTQTQDELVAKRDADPDCRYPRRNAADEGRGLFEEIFGGDARRRTGEGGGSDG